MKLTKKAAVQMVDEIIAEVGPDKITPFDGCIYFAEPKKEKAKRPPSCLVGHVFYKAGIRYSDLKDEYGSDEPNRNMFGPYNMELLDLLRTAGLTFTHDAAEYLENLQGLQDGGRPWGECQETLKDSK